MVFRLLWVFTWVAAFPACASAPPSKGAIVEPARLRVPFRNTSDTCPVAAVALVETAGGRVEVPPGATAEIALAEGTHQVTVQGEPQVWTVPSPSPRFWGCTDPRFLTPHAGGVAVRLVHRPHGCQSGVRGPVAFRLGDAPLGTLAPGESAERYLPAGHNAALAAGCEPPVSGLVPMTVIHRRGACAQGSATLEVRASAHRESLEAGEAWTLYLPRATYLAQVGSERLRLEVGPDGVVVERQACAAAQK